MKTIRIALIFTLTALTACSGSPYRNVYEGEVIETKYVLFSAPSTSWEVHVDVASVKNKEGSNPGIYAHLSGASYQINVTNWPYPEPSELPYFDSDAQYLQVLRDEDMEITKVHIEQGIGYERQWVNYVQGMKCSEGVFSRNGRGGMAGITMKDYSMRCGYYHKELGRRLIHVTYRYNYAGGEVRHQGDEDIPQSELFTRDQAERVLKQAVKHVVDTMEIKRIDRARMAREGLIHDDKAYEISGY